MKFFSLALMGFLVLSIGCNKKKDKTDVLSPPPAEDVPTISEIAGDYESSCIITVDMGSLYNSTSYKMFLDLKSDGTYGFQNFVYNGT